MRYARGDSPSMVENCKFEICYPKTKCLHGSRNILQQVWYKAAVVKEAPKNSKSRGRVLCVRLLKDDFSTPLSQFRTISSVIQPVPPRSCRDDFGIGFIVQADYKNAWVTGFVVKKIDVDNYLVCFVSPPDVIQFDRKHLRLHLDWLDQRRDKCWLIQPKLNNEFLRRLAKQPMFSPGTMVEVSSKINETEVVWLPAMVIKEFKGDDGDADANDNNDDDNDDDDDDDADDDENHDAENDDDEYKYIVNIRVCDKSLSNKARPNKIVDFRNLRPTPPSISVDEYQSEEHVEVFHCDMGWRQGRVMRTLPQKRYTVLLEATKMELAFNHWDLRPLKVWEDGVWKTRESSLTQGSGDDTGDSVMNANESDPPLTPPPGITTPQLTQVEAETQRKALPKKTLPRNQNGSADESIQENGSSEDINRKRKREEELCSVACAEEDKAKDTTMVLPFEKKLPIWKTLESMEVFKTVPQSPHFSPLAESREDYREMSAVGMMLTFSGLLDEVKALQQEDPISSLLSLSDSFSKLEKHGFNVKAPQLRISKLLSLRDRQSKKTDELKSAEKAAVEKERVLVENERKIRELQRLNENTEKEIAESKSCAAKIVQQLDDVKLDIQTTASAPW
ncbi:hypothetical protein CARUB_v10000478mg [Capsella rubella]|uniref:Agenet domain-containing protein n=1 Tax=Capsella rubella TaxID=81985 RepID=R0FE71_9BRAS|nr:DUF724 domain-containing protein 8 [Capsella rubella]EOA20181.1 hypothetical protein CARUB_v10000478mg [Capsella rubella]